MPRTIMFKEPLPINVILEDVFVIPVSAELKTGGTLTGSVRVTFYIKHDDDGRTSGYGIRESSLVLGDPQVVTTVKTVIRDEAGAITGTVDLPGVVPLR